MGLAEGWPDGGESDGIIKTDWTEAITDLTGQVRSEMGAAKLDLAIVFVHPQFIPQIKDLVQTLRKSLGVRHLIGCTGAGIIGDVQEVEKRAAISVLVGEMPDVQVAGLHITENEVEESSGPDFWHFQWELAADAHPSFITLIDPFSIRVIQMIDQLAEAYPGAPVVGGLASGAEQPGENRLFLDDEIFDDGVVAVALTGGVELRTIVSQGCRPIGHPLVVTRAEKNIVFELGGKPPIEVLQELLPQLTARDQQLARKALFIGRVINEYQENFGRGDFLIRNLIGTDPQSGALAVGDWMRTGQTVQFQVRDGNTADEDLRHLLSAEKQDFEATPPKAAVLFSCLGRGEGMYGVPNHDVGELQQVLGPLPVAGFFCNGEIGPVGERPFVHGFTSVIGFFMERK